MDKKIYSIKDETGKERKFFIGKFVPGQLVQLQQIHSGSIHKTLSIEWFEEIQGDITKMLKIVAVMVTEAGVSLKKKNVDEVTELFQWELEPEEVVKMFTTFFPNSETNSDGSTKTKSSNVTELNPGKAKKK